MNIKKYLLAATLILSLTAHAQTADEWFAQGNAKYEQNDKAGAITDYNRAIQINPQYAQAYYNRGNAKSALGDKAGAIIDYNQAIQINPQDALAY